MTMPTMVALAATLIGGATIPFTLNNAPTPTLPAHSTTLAVPVNGDFNQFLPEHRASYADEMRQHTARLQRIESVLRARDVSSLSDNLRAERARNLDRLHNYWIRGEYPTVAAHSGARRPCFIDDAGRICAVGYLVEQSAGRDVAERINAKYRPNTIREIKDPTLASWIAASGLSYDEVVAIQGPEIQMAPQIPVQQQSQISENRRGRNGRRAMRRRAVEQVQTAEIPVANAEPAGYDGVGVGAVQLVVDEPNPIAVEEPTEAVAPTAVETVNAPVELAPAPVDAAPTETAPVVRGSHIE